jgi:hypothetical protein
MRGTSITTHNNELDVLLPNFGVGSYIVNMLRPFVPYSDREGPACGVTSHGRTYSDLSVCLLGCC